MLNALFKPPVSSCSNPRKYTCEAFSPPPSLLTEHFPKKPYPDPQHKYSCSPVTVNHFATRTQSAGFVL